MTNEKTRTLTREGLFSKTRSLTIKKLLFLFAFTLIFPAGALIAGDIESESSGAGESAQTMSNLGISKGYCYRYAAIMEEDAGTSQDVYITDETDDAWTGIVATIFNDKVTFQRFELNKKSLVLRSTDNLKKSKIKSNQREKFHHGKVGEGILAFGYPDRPRGKGAVISSAKPYILLETKYIKLVNVEKKDFSISEYEQYESYEDIAEVGKFKIGHYELKPDGTMVLDLENNVSKDKEITYFIVGTQVTKVNKILKAQSSRQFSFPTGQPGSAGQEYSVFVEIRFQDTVKKHDSTYSIYSMEFEGLYGEKREY